MNRIIITLFIIAGFLTACGGKQQEGTLTYQLAYKLPDSLKNYADYLPKTATMHFKGDSAVTVQGTEDESTTMITYHPTGYFLALLKSGFKRFQVQFNTDEQKMEVPDMSVYDFTKGTGTKTIAGYKAEQYIVKNKFSGDTTSAWFTHDLKVPPSFLSMMFNPEYGVPVSFSINQNGMVTTTTLKEAKFAPVPAGVFSAPKGYLKLTPKELREMPVEN